MISIPVFGWGFFSGFYQLFPYSLIQKSYILITNNISKLNSYNSIGLTSCQLPKLQEVPKNSTVIIGHAYGSPGKSNSKSFIANNVRTFLDQNSHKLDMVIFSGDVFGEPSMAKWAQLSREYANSFKIEIAPGNHDIGSLSAADIFNMTDFNNKEPSIVSNTNSHAILVEDSVSSNWLLAPETKDIIKQFYDKNLFLVRHNIPTTELFEFANSSFGMSKQLPPTQTLVAEFQENRSITVISGDGGAFPHLPREKCLEINNFKFIINGIGEVPGDTVLLLNNGLLYSFEI